jgi:CDP-diacylglycerol--glycerol-3-phosphate 3-phosphatidyltransferase
MISERIGTWARAKLLVVGEFLGGLGLTPNLLTIIGFLLNCAVAAIIATGNIRLGGVLLLFSSGFDMLDGSVARATGQTSKFGGFFDSTVDRYSEIVVYVGLLYYLLDTDDWKTGALLVLLAATGALMISYARARAEAAGWKAAVGLLARTERVVLLSLGLVIGKPIWALWILAIGTHITAVTRMYHVWRVAGSEGAESGPTAAKSGDAQPL